jgi:surface protein
MEHMFYGASAFNQDLSKWDVSKVTVMASMFYGASAFNQDLSKWDVSKVTVMASMFYGASAFNQDLSKWDVSKVTTMASMFYGASAFDRELSGVAWGHSKADKPDMFKDSPGSISKVCTRDKTGNHEDEDHPPLVVCVRREST